MPRGYARLTATRAGAGATELWGALAGAGAAGDQRSLRGVTAAAFDRSFYLRFPTLGERLVARVPPLVAVGSAALRPGPLMTAVEGAERRRLPAGWPEAGTEVDVVPLGGDWSAGLSLAVGRCLHVDVPRSALLPLPRRAVGHREGGPPVAKDVTRRARSLLSWTAAAGTADALGVLGQLRQRTASDRVDGAPTRAAPTHGDTGGPVSLDALAGAVVDALDRAPDAEPGPARPLVSLLGRGPGATPAGDDLLVGLLLTLQASGSAGRQRRVRGLWDRLLPRAVDRTTRIGVAHLEQARLGRAAAPLAGLLDALLGSEPSEDGGRAAARRLVETGHTSGPDLLAGVMLATVAVLPELSAGEADPPR